MKQFKKQKKETSSVFRGLKMLKETATTLLVIDFSEKILLQVTKEFLKGVSRTYIAVIKAYKKSKKWKGFEEDILINRVRLYARKRRGIKFKNDFQVFEQEEQLKNQIEMIWKEGSSKEGKIVGSTFSQLRETNGDQVSSDKTEEITNWMNRVLEERANWLWDWTKCEESPAWEDDYNWIN